MGGCGCFPDGLQRLIDCHSLRLFLRTDSSPLENSDVNKCGAVEYPCPRSEFRGFSLRDALKQKYRTKVSEAVGSAGRLPNKANRRRRLSTGKFFTEGVPACSNYGSNLIINTETAPLQNTAMEDLPRHGQRNRERSDNRQNRRERVGGKM